MQWITFFEAAILAVCGFTLFFVSNIVCTIGRLRMSTQEAVDAVVEQLGKATAEIVSKIEDVQAQLVAAQVPADVVNLDALKAAAQALDDIVPDEGVDVATDEVTDSEEASV